MDWEKYKIYEIFLVICMLYREGGREVEKQPSKVKVGGGGGWYEMITETVWFNQFKFNLIRLIEID